MNRTLLCLVGLVVCSCASLAGWTAEPAAKPAPSKTTYEIRTDRTGSQPNWLTGQLEVVGVGYASTKTGVAKGQARATALSMMTAEARSALGRVPVDASILLSAALKTNEQRQLADEAVSNLNVINETWDAEHGIYTVVGVLPLYGNNGLTLLGSKALGAAKPQEWKIEQLTLTTPIPRGRTPQQFEAPYTGIIVDGDAVLATTCMYPRLVRFDGKEFWGPSNLSPAAMITDSFRYASNLQTAIAQKLAGERPVIVSAIGTTPDGYPVFNVDDVYLLLREQKAVRLLEKSMIVITLGRK